MQDVINESLNTGMVYVQQAMSKSDFKKYITSYNWGEKTGIDLPGEVSGLTSNIQSNRDVEYSNISFGQGIAMTPISMIRSLASLANGGVLMQPYVVQRIDYVGGLHDTIKPAQQARVLTQETTDEITRMLVEAVDSTLLGGDAKMDHYSIAAKTGTAQIPDPTGGYYSDRNLHSFFGYFPAYDPEFIVFLYTMHPQGVRYSSQTLAQPFMDMADFLINYYQVPPDREPLPVSTENE
jgi:cell division protein FtsI/penicillin-binding protein 2